MRVCHCTLYITNPDACKKCPENSAVGVVQNSESADNRVLEQWKDGCDEYHRWIDLLNGWRARRIDAPKPMWTIKTKKITEKYDENGNLIEKIIEEGSNNG